MSKLKTKRQLNIMSNSEDKENLQSRRKELSIKAWSQVMATGAKERSYSK